MVWQIVLRGIGDSVPAPVATSTVGQVEPCSDAAETDLGTSQRWEFPAKNEIWSIQVTRGGTVLRITAHERSEGFAEDFRHTVRTVL